MKIFDCFMYFDEDVILDVRLNTLYKYVDYFIIVESSFTHKGDKRDLKFDIDKFTEFKDKIIYLVFDQEPNDIERLNDDDVEDEKSRKLILNAARRENVPMIKFLVQKVKIDIDLNDKLLPCGVDDTSSGWSRWRRTASAS